jgi:hypothetical protein
LHLDATVEFVDYVSLAHHEDLKNFTEATIADFLVDLACNTSSAGANSSDALIELRAVKVSRNETNDSTAPATPPAEEGKCTSAVVRLFGNPFHIHAELPYSPEAEAALSDPAVPMKLSNFFIKVPSVILYSSSPPICEFAHVSAANVTSVIPGCENHLEHLIKEFRAAYTNRMVPWALDAACGAFATTLSFATTNKPSDEDKAFCEKATKHLMHHHYKGVDFYSADAPAEKDYQDWCVNVCEYRHGPTAICAVASENATNATANASLFVKASRRVLKRMQNVL